MEQSWNPSSSCKEAQVFEGPFLELSASEGDGA